jgi:hypothetical protein
MLGPFLVKRCARRLHHPDENCLEGAVRTFFLGLLLFSNSHILAEPLQNISVTGSARVRSEWRNNSDFADQLSDSQDLIGSRFRLEAKFQPNERLLVFLQPQFTRLWGQAEYVPSGAAVNTETTTSGGTRDPGFDVHQGYIDYLVNPSLGASAGRKEFNFGDQLLAGGLGWSHVGRAFDQVGVNFNYGFGVLDLFSAKVKDNNIAQAGPGDREFSGVYSANSVSDSLKELDGYFFLANDRSTAPQAKTHAYGLRAKSPVGRFDYRTEATFERVANATTESDEHQFDIELGYQVFESGALRFAAEYLRASRNFDQLYPTGHKWLGYADLFSRRNIEGLRVGVSGRASEKWTVSLDYHQFKRTNAALPAYKYSGAAYGAVGQDLEIASEIDLVATYKVEPGLTLEGGASRVEPGAYLRANSAADVAAFYYLQASVNF